MTNSAQEFGSFGYRVAGVLINDGRILLFSDELVDFWVIPGGGVKLFESSEQAIIREFQEEIGVTIAVERLLWVVENSFTFDNQRVHGIELTFLVKSLDSEEKLAQDEFFGYEKDLQAIGGRYKNIENLKMNFRWFHPTELDSITIQPKIYNDELKNIPDYPKLLRNLEIENKKL
ncbi:MAG: NUDIX domain-containing protein [Asgard group archaeon]|nr:NUDIX domain-containing protein [Asgard group archaeon]